MKIMKRRIASLFLAVVMVLAMAMPVMAVGTGSITIQSNDEVGVAGKTFNAYKILDVVMADETNAEEGITYTVPVELKDFYKDFFKFSDEDAAELHFDTLVVGKIAELKDNAEALQAFAKAALDAAKEAGITPAAGKGEEGDTEVVILGLPLGYYVIEDAGTKTPISALMLDTTQTSAVVKIKADVPSIEKKIDGTIDTDPSTSDLVDYNNTSIGDVVPYVVTSKVPDMTGYTKYTFVVHDTLSKGLTLIQENRTVTTDEGEVTVEPFVITIGGQKLTQGTDFTVATEKNADGETLLTITFIDFINYKDNVGADIQIEYAATVNSDAVIGVEGNPNKLTLEYSNSPYPIEKPDGSTDHNPTGTTPEDETRTYVTGIKITKVDENGNRLTGAEFEITGERVNHVLVKKEAFTENVEGTYWELKDGTYTTDDPNGEGMDQSKYVDTTKKYKKETVTKTIETTDTVKATATVGDDGVLVFTGLGAGTYTITEIKAPDGYNLLTEPITVQIGWAAPTEGAKDCTWSIVDQDGDVTYNVEADIFEVTVENNKGTELPETGGMGTTLFYLIGGILVIGAAVLLVAKKRMNSEE